MSALSPTIVVLGGSNRIAEQCAQIFLSNGWSAFLADTDGKALDEIQESFGDKVGTLKADPNKLIGLDNIISGVNDQFGRIDAVCHIPEIPEPFQLLDSTTKEFDEKIVKAARSSTLAIRRFGKHFIEQQKEMDPADIKKTNYSFTHVFGMGAHLFDMGRYSQNAGQSMALAACKAAAFDLAPYHIRSNSVVAIRPRAENEEPWLKDRTPLGRHSYAEEISDAVYFLANKGAANMTGQTIVMDGGRSILNGLSVDQHEL